MSAAIVADLREIILQRFKTAPLRELLDLHDAQPMKPIPLIVPRFEVIDDELVIDHSTGLTWLRGYVPAEAAKALLTYIDDHDWGHIPEGVTGDHMRDALAKLEAL